MRLWSESLGRLLWWARKTGLWQGISISVIYCQLTKLLITDPNIKKINKQGEHLSFPLGISALPFHTSKPCAVCCAQTLWWGNGWCRRLGLVHSSSFSFAAPCFLLNCSNMVSSTGRSPFRVIPLESPLCPCPHWYLASALAQAALCLQHLLRLQFFAISPALLSFSGIVSCVFCSSIIVSFLVSLSQLLPPNIFLQRLQKLLWFCHTVHAFCLLWSWHGLCPAQGSPWPLPTQINPVTPHEEEIPKIQALTLRPTKAPYGSQGSKEVVGWEREMQVRRQALGCWLWEPLCFSSWLSTSWRLGRRQLSPQSGGIL